MDILDDGKGGLQFRVHAPIKDELDMQKQHALMKYLIVEGFIEIHAP